MRRAVAWTIAGAAIVLWTACEARPVADPSLNLRPAARPAPIRVEGRVTLDGAEDFSGVQVYIAGSSALAMTDAEGRYSLEGLSPGPAIFRAQYPGYRPAELARFKIPESTEEQSIQLEDFMLSPLVAAAPEPAPAVLGAIEGRLSVNWDNEVVSTAQDLLGARIEIEGTSMRTFTEADGSFYLWNLRPGSYALLVELQGFPSHRTEIEVVAGAPTRVEIALAPLDSSLTRRQILGRVQLFASDGTEVRDYQRVALGIEELPDRSVDIQADGSFRIGPLAASVYTLVTLGRGYESDGDLEIDLREIAAAEVTVTFRETTPAPQEPAAVTGIVVLNDENLADMSGISVALAGTSHVSLSDSEGRYRLEGVVPGVYELIAHSDGFEPVSVVGLDLEAGEEVVLNDLFLEPLYDYPRVIDTNPPDGAEDIQVRYQFAVMVRFSKKMRPESLREAIGIEPALAFEVFAGKERPETDFDLAMILIDGGSEDIPMLHDTAYRITIETGAEDFEGLGLEEPFELEFRTAEPGVMDTQPVDNAQNVIIQPSRPVIFRFNVRLDPKSVKADAVRVRPSLGFIPTVQLVDRPKTGWSEIHIQATWRQDTQYTVRLSRRIKTARGKPLSNAPYTFRFTTAKLEQMPATIGPIPR